MYYGRECVLTLNRRDLTQFVSIFAKIILPFRAVKPPSHNENPIVNDSRI